MLPFLTGLLAFPLTVEPAPEAPPGPGFDVSPKIFPALVKPEDEVDPAEYGKWHGSISFGAIFADGNTDRTTLSLLGKAEDRREKDRITLGLLWNYAEEENVLTQRRTYGSAKYDYFFTKKFYGLAQATGENDYNAMLDLRLTYGLGAGYQFREDERWNILGEAGLSYVDENYKDDAADADYLAARLAYKVEYTPSESWSAGQGAQVYPSLENPDDVNALVDTHAKVTLAENLFAQLQWLFTYDNTPASGADRVDNLYLLTLGWSF